MIKRTLSGVVILVLVSAWLFFSHVPAVLYIGTLILGAWAVFEIVKICKTEKPHQCLFIMLISVLLLLLPVPYYEYVTLLVLPVALLLFGFMMAKKERIHALTFPWALAVSIAVILLYKAVPHLRNAENGLYYLTFAVIACFVSDVAALLFGKAFGKRKLCPRISPKKTVAGVIGGVACTTVIALVAALLLQRLTALRFDCVMLTVWALLVSAIGQFGDLCMSVVKRIADVKDFGKVFPGHGGILDRFDSQMTAVAFTLAFCTLTGGFIY